MTIRELPFIRGLPTGGSLPDEVWARRHRGVVVLLWLHAVGIAGFAGSVGEALHHALTGALPVAAAAVLAGSGRLSRGVRSGAATIGLVTASAVLVHLSGGLIEMHFHFFVMIGIITLYQDWLPFLLALGYVVIHHGVLGTLAAEGVYNHPAAWNKPWMWALIHGVFVLAASTAHLTAWRLNEQGFQDALTGLANRSLFEDRLRHALLRTQRSGTPLSVLFLDLDDFKTVNDSLGHAAGDVLLVAVASRFKDCLRAADTAARVGGDEFAILLEGADQQQATVVAGRIHGVLGERLVVHGKELFIGASIGIAESYGQGDASDLLRNADAAMYVAKRNGKRRSEVFLESMHVAVLDRLELLAELQRAVDGDEFTLHYQPIFALGDRRMVGVEALVRWQHPRRGLISPAEFIPLAEETGLIVPIGSWVLTEACHQVEAWNRQARHRTPLTVSVNLSARQLQASGLVQLVATVLGDSGLDPGNLILEITESVLVHDPEIAILRLSQLKALGLQLAIDDFGTGYSSLNYLQRFPVDILKIDKSFIDGVTGGPKDSALARAIIKLGPTMGLEVTAEGIETAEQLAELAAMKCDLGQGFYFSKPLDLPGINQLLGDHEVGPPSPVDIEPVPQASRR